MKNNSEIFKIIINEDLPTKDTHRDSKINFLGYKRGNKLNIAASIDVKNEIIKWRPSTKRDLKTESIKIVKYPTDHQKKQSIEKDTWEKYYMAPAIELV